MPSKRPAARPDVLSKASQKLMGPHVMTQVGERVTEQSCASQQWPKGSVNAV